MTPRFPFGVRSNLLNCAATAILLSMTVQTALAQARTHEVDIPIALRFVAAAATAPPGSCGCFWLRGGALDVAIPLLPHLSAQVELAGLTVNRVPASTRGLSELTLLAGPRYTVPLRHASVSAHALFGAVRGFDADFVSGANRVDTSTSFAMTLGGALELPLNRRLSVRIAEVDWLQTNLPNGTGDRQRNIRVGAGVVFHVPLPASR
jgi:hypothetical protein